ncbi:DUF6314 family protein [Histidinibacterium lentulum]|uniref:Trigger factor n=1 Tax=Histidinibacterium lentulum TaxID=2480588 RepID=A0A3N2R4F1_9RHOB|nr:DUF6314 family protein [Histidinibacterium lentulum]ROU02370.1 trigger factor [Histidinibacterium lentulum]
MVDLGFLAGEWRLARRVDDARAGAVLRFEGTARFLRDGAGLCCEESGRWIGGAQDGMAGTRRSLWRDGGDGRIAVLFGDGRPFHDFEPGGEADAVHLCGADRYAVRYRFGEADWEAVWRVTGPFKDYVMISRYGRG